MPADLPPRITDAPWLERPETQAVFAAISRERHVTRAVGGCVRNALMGVPVTDVDIATTAVPETVMRLAEAAGLKPVPTGLSHGTVTIVSGHVPYEVTTLRHDVETDGRHAKVAFTDDWAADASRRDFTMNALYCGADGTVFDPLGGYADLAARRVRFIGDPRERIREDRLRILRFFRFNATYGEGAFDREGLTASIRERDGLAQLSPERVHSEVSRLLAARNAAVAIETMQDWGLLTQVLGGVPYLPAFKCLVAIECTAGRPPDATLRLATLAVRLPEDALRLAMRFRLSNAERDTLLMLAAIAPCLQGGLPELKAALYRLGPERYRMRALFQWAILGGSADDPAWRAVAGLPDRWQSPPFPVAGRHLVALGVPHGPEVGRLLKVLEGWWLEGGFSADRDQLLARARELMSLPPSG